MDKYFTFTTLLGLRGEGGNLPSFKEAKNKRFQSVQRILELVDVAVQTRPSLPSSIITLNPLDRTSLLTQPNGTTRCPSQSSTESVTGDTPAAFPSSWYPPPHPVLLLLQLQRLHHQYPLQNLPQHIPLLCRLPLRRRLLLLPQADPQNQSL